MSSIQSICSRYIPSALSFTGAKCSKVLANLSERTTLLALGVLALSMLPTTEAGGGAYMACIQTCVQSMGMNWASTFICPTICAPFLLGPG